MTVVSPRSVDATFDALEAMQTAVEPEAVMAALARSMATFGFEAFILTRLPRPPGPLEPHILLNGWPAAWFDRYAEANHYLHDPVAAHCRTASTPFSWDELPAELTTRRQASAVRLEARDFGLNQGLCVPLRDHLGLGGMSLCGSDVSLTPDVRRMAWVLSTCAGATLQRLPPRGARHPKLTDRERDVLRWIATGKTVEEVGAILGISSHTVGEHLKHVRRKLQAANTVQAMVEAIRLGLVTL